MNGWACAGEFRETMLLKKENIPLVLIIIYCSVIFTLSSIPGTELSGIPAPDYIMHAVEYAGLGLLICWWRIIAGEPPARAVLQTIVMASLYGMSDEFHQYFVPGRCTTFSDWAADTIGAAAGAGIFMAVRTRLKNSAGNVS